MRYIGCKKRLLPFIHQVLKDHYIEGGVFCDLFSGTATVGQYFKRQGFSIISNDFLQASYVQQCVKILLNTMPKFNIISKELGLAIKSDNSQARAEAILHYLNNLPGKLGFMYQHYSPGAMDGKLIIRLYFTARNAMKIDIIRDTLELWLLTHLINEDEFCVLLFSLLEAASRCANTVGIQSAFLKYWAPNALKPLELRLPDIAFSNQKHSVYCQDSLSLIKTLKNIDVLYLDPPYTRKQYAASYHLLETIVRWDRPVVRGISGMRETKHIGSTFSRKTQALESLKQIVSQRNYKHLLLSYSTDGLIPHDVILNVLSQYGEVTVYTQKLPRYNSNASSSPLSNLKRQVEERLYYLKHVNPMTLCSISNPVDTPVAHSFCG